MPWLVIAVAVSVAGPAREARELTEARATRDPVDCPSQLERTQLYALRDVFTDRDLDRIVADPIWRALVTTPGLYAHNVVPFADGDEQATSYVVVVDGRLDLHVPLGMPAPYVGEVSLHSDSPTGKTWCAHAEQGFYSGKL